MLRPITTQVRKLNLDDSDRIEERERTEQERLINIAARSDVLYLKRNLEDFFLEKAGELSEALIGVHDEEYGKVIDQMFREYCNEVAESEN